MSNVVNFPIIPRSTVIPIAVPDDEHAATRLARVFRTALAEAEGAGISLNEMRTLLVNALQYIDAKIAARSL